MAHEQQQDTGVAQAALEQIWQLTGLRPEVINNALLDIQRPTLPSSFHVADFATATVAAAALAASELWHLRSGQQQTVSVNSRHAEAEFTSDQRLIVGDTPPEEVWGPIAGLYQCGDGRWIRIHANFPHHERGVLEVLKCPCDREAVMQELQRWTAQDFEDACGKKGLVVFMMRSPEEWAAHPQGKAVAALPIFDIEKLSDGPVEALPSQGIRPLSGIKVLDLTRVIAGPICGRTLATHGADVTRISAARLPRDSMTLEIDGGRGKRSRFIDLKDASGNQQLEALARESDVFVQGYRPGAIDATGFTPERLAELRPGIVYVSISAWGHEGPWAHRRGFDSLVQTASGVNSAEGDAAGSDGPKPLPCQALDFGSGHLMAMGAMAGLYKRATEGGSWRVRVALARTGHWFKSLGRIENGFNVTSPTNDDVADLMTTLPSAYGELNMVRYPARLSITPAHDDLVSEPYPHTT